MGDVTQTNDPMGILKVLIGDCDLHDASCYTDQRSDGDTERCSMIIRASCAGVVTQTNDPMGILKVLSRAENSVAQARYTDQRSDGDTERPPPA